MPAKAQPTDRPTDIFPPPPHTHVQYIYQMYKMSKTFGKGDGSKPVLKDVSLSFYPGVKIGVLGGNGTQLTEASGLLNVSCCHIRVT